MKAKIIHAADVDEDEFATEERCHILEIANSADDPAVSIARARVEPGVTTAWHKLTATVERYLIVAGEGSVELDYADPVIVKIGDVVTIPAETPQRITNTGTTDLIFYAICSPRFSQDCYVGLESS